MKRLTLDPMDFGGHSWPAHWDGQLRRAGFRMKPITKLFVTSDDIVAAIEPPYTITRDPLGRVTVEQGESHQQNSSET